MRFIKVQVFSDDADVTEVLDDILDEVTKPDESCAEFWNFQMTYRTDLDVVPGNIVIVPVHRTATDSNEIHFAIVREVLKDATSSDFAFPVKEILFKLDADTAVAKIVKQRRNAELLTKMKQRAQELDQLAKLQKYAESDDTMKSLLSEYQSNQDIINTPLIGHDDHDDDDDSDDNGQTVWTEDL